MTASAEYCNGCRFWLADEASGEFDEHLHSFGRCRRHPPKVSDHMAAIAFGTPGFGEQFDPEDLADTVSVARASLLPATFCTDWCGEFQPTAPEMTA